MDQKVLREAYAAFPSGVVALCALVDGEPVGMAASSFVAVSIEPPLVAFCVQHTSTTWPRLAGLARIGVSVLGESHDRAARTLAARTGNRFEGVTTEVTEAGSVFVGDSSAWLDCSVQDQVTAGDHDIVVLRVHALHAVPGVEPLVFHGSAFRKLRQLTSD
ncbi:oxidoreductase [Modestobacter sp. I12A-02628]|uniref:Flavin reductase family protein n=1 Tax=Goekera deserti TaxID=2497753 RepID=A0A7K3WIT4_9ACTN|nr:oxidoreductase [Goekera deserti]NDI46598.1 oxidoreductase [Goekera deserti]NEL56354.1 flavin reductase family protein [Goekera deserti]